MPLNPSIGQPKIVPGGGEPLVNFDEVDTRSGTGFVEYFLGIGEANSTSGGLLVDNAFYSEEVNTVVVSAPGTAFVQLIDKDFDILFNKPQTLRGTAVVNIPVGIQEQDADVYREYIHARIRKWDGTTETPIADASGAIMTSTGGAAAYTYKVHAINITVPQTNFKKGETLRLTVEQYGEADTGAKTTCCVC